MHDAVGDFFNHLFEQQPQVRSAAIIRGRMCRTRSAWRAELVTLFEGTPQRIVRVVNRDGLSAMLPHHGETWHVGRAVADVDHVLERYRPKLGRHVVVHVLRVIEHPFVDPEKELRLLRVADDAARKGDPSFAVLRKFASEDRAHMRRET